MVFHRQTTNDPDWTIGTFVETNAQNIANMLSADSKSTIGTWASAEEPVGWRYVAIAVYYFAWEGRTGFGITDPLITRAQAEHMNLPRERLIRLTNDGEFSRFAPVQGVIEHFAWKDVHELAEEKLKKEVIRRRYGHLFEGEFSGSLEEWTLKPRVELVSGTEVKSEEDQAHLEEDVKVKVEDLADSEMVVGSSANLVEAVRSSVVKTDPGVSVASAPALEIASAPLESTRTINLSRFVRLPGPLSAPLSLHKRKAPESESESVQRRRKQ